MKAPSFISDLFIMKKTNIIVKHVELLFIYSRSFIYEQHVDKGFLDSLLKKMFIVSSEVAMSESVEAMGNLLDKLGERKYLIQITDETPELRISLFDRLDQSLFRIEYFFKEINVGEDSCYYAYFIRKTRTSTTS